MKWIQIEKTIIDTENLTAIEFDDNITDFPNIIHIRIHTIYDKELVIRSGRILDDLVNEILEQLNAKDKI